MGPTFRRTLFLLTGLLARGVAADDAFVVNGYTSGAALVSAIGSDAAGDFVIVWQGERSDETGYGVFGRRYDAQGTPLAAEFRVNTYTTGNQTAPSVAVVPDGRFVVAWFDAQRARVVARRYAADGSPASGEFQVNSYTTVAPSVFFPVGGGTSAAFEFTDTPFPGPSVATDANGDFLVTWDSTANPAPCGGPPCARVQARRYNAAGTAAGPQFQVSAFTTAPYPFAEGQPSVAAVGDDHFVVAWNIDIGFLGAVGGWDSNNAPSQAFLVGGFFTSAPPPPAFPMNPVVRSRGDGAFVVTWDQFTVTAPDTLDLSVRVQPFASIPPAGSVPATDSILVAPAVPFFTTDPATVLRYGLLARPGLSVADNGGFVVAAPRGLFEGDDSPGISARRFLAGGGSNGSAFPIAQGDLAFSPALASQPLGAFVATWTGLDSVPVVLARRVSDATPPLVKVTFPNSGARLTTGITSALAWTATDDTGLEGFEVFLSRDGGATFDPAPICALPVSGSSPYGCNWTVTGPPTSQARIKVVATSSGGAVGEDVSNGDSRIVSAFVTVTAPDSAGVVWVAGKTHPIHIIHNLGKAQPVLFEINRDYPDGVWEPITGSAGCSSTTGADASLCNWIASGVTNGAAARIRASSVEAPGVRDTSNVSFEISSRVKVSVPNTAVTWKVGTSKSIKWTHNYGVPTSFDISLDNDGDGDCDDALIQAGVAGTATNGNYTWTVAGAGTENRVCVRATPADPDGNDASDVTFTITP